MRVLLLGANGFIGRELFAALRNRGHLVVPGVRRHADALRLDPGVEPILIDLNRDIDPDAWRPRLERIDAVVNCAGILQGSRRQSMVAIHTRAPIALFRACEEAGVRRVVQISAISADPAAGTDYAKTKRAADDALRASTLEWIVLRPSLVIGRGAFGGTALFRALAALPFAIPLPGQGSQVFAPLHVDDLARVVCLALEDVRFTRTTIDPVGRDVVTLRTLLQDYRRWLGFGDAHCVAIPLPLVRIAARFGDLLGGPLNSTALAQMQRGNSGNYESFRSAAGFETPGWKEALVRQPAHWQDRWHARLYFVRPLLRLAIALLWLGSGLTGLAALGEWAPALAFHLDTTPIIAGSLLAAACLGDIALAALVMARWRPRALTTIQVLVVCGYTLVATWFWPALWLNPLGALLKNVPILAAMLVLGAIETDR